MPKARIIKAKVNFISLCARGANRLPVMYKSDEGFAYFDPLTKANMDQGEITAVVYAPNMVDSQGEYADAEVIRDMAHEFGKTGEGVDIKHNNVALSKEVAFVAENFIIQKGDPRFADMRDYQGNPVDVTGGWGVVIKIEDQGLRQAYREGKWNGVSMGGFALREAEKSSQGDFDMDFKDLQKALDASSEKTAAAVVSGLTEALKTAGLIKPDLAKDDKKAPAAPTFKGDYSDKIAVRKHLKACRIHKLTVDNDPATPEGFEAIAKGMEEIDEQFADLNDPNTPLSPLEKAAGCDENDTPEVRALRVRLHKATGASKQRVKKADASDDAENFLGATDGDEQEAIKLAREMAKADYGDPSKN